MMRERDIDWGQAMKIIVPLLPDDYNEQNIPPGWLDEVVRLKKGR